jgi:hypothetical protein
MSISLTWGEINVGLLQSKMHSSLLQSKMNTDLHVLLERHFLFQHIYEYAKYI